MCLEKEQLRWNFWMFIGSWNLWVSIGTFLFKGSFSRKRWHIGILLAKKSTQVYRLSFQSCRLPHVAHQEMCFCVYSMESHRDLNKHWSTSQRSLSAWKRGWSYKKSFGILYRYICVCMYVCILGWHFSAFHMPLTARKPAMTSQLDRCWRTARRSDASRRCRPG